MVDITDLSYVNKMVDITGTPKVLDTAAIVSATVEQEGLTVTDGSLESLFTGESTVTVAPAEGPRSCPSPSPGQAH